MRNQCKNQHAGTKDAEHTDEFAWVFAIGVALHEQGVSRPDIPNACSVQSLGMKGSNRIRLPYSSGIRPEWLITASVIAANHATAFLRRLSRVNR